MTVDLVLRLPGGLDKVAVVARRSLSAFDGVLDSGLLESLELLVSELVTNSLRHADLGLEGWVELRISAEPATMRVRAEVADSGPGFAGTPGTGGQAAGTGWGFYLVERLAAEWGVGAGAGGQVWFVLRDQEAAAR